MPFNHRFILPCLRDLLEGLAVIANRACADMINRALPTTPLLNKFPALVEIILSFSPVGILIR